MERSLSLRSSGVQGVRGVQEANCGARPVERRLALVLRSFSEGGCEADRSGRAAIRARERSPTTALR
jgi:hypothetical protein